MCVLVCVLCEREREREGVCVCVMYLQSTQFSFIMYPPPPPLSLSLSRLMDLYMVMHHKLHSSSTPLKILYHIGNKEALLGWVSNLMLVHIKYRALNIIFLSTHVRCQIHELL